MNTSETILDKKSLLPLPRDMPTHKNYMVGYPKMTENYSNKINTNTLYQAWIYFRLNNPIYLQYFNKVDNQIEQKLVDKHQLDKYFEMYKSIEHIFEDFIKTVLIQETQARKNNIQTEQMVILSWWFNKSSEDRFILCKNKKNLMTMVLPTNRKQVELMNDLLQKNNIFGQRAFIEMYVLA